jgi:hypothetical protein
MSAITTLDSGRLFALRMTRVADIAVEHRDSAALRKRQ